MLDAADIIKRNHIQIVGEGEKVLMFAHGFGCNQQMWRFLLPYFLADYRIVLFDYVGSGNSDLSAYSKTRYSSLAGYANDIVEICQALDLNHVHLVGHSVSGNIALIAAQSIPERIQSLVMVCPSPCFLNCPPDYYGGFNSADLQELIDLMDKNYIGWANFLAPLVTGTSADDALTNELNDSFCTTNPVTAKNFAKVTFFSDCRDLLPKNQHPVLILQSEQDALAAVEIGEYMHRHLANSELVVLPARGHCLHMSDAKTVAGVIAEFFGRHQTNAVEA